MGDKGDKNAARPPEGSLVETRCLIKGPKSAIVPFAEPRSGPKSRTGSGASQVECLSWLNSSLFILLGKLKWIKNRILLSFIAGPKTQARRHFLTHPIRIITYLFWSLNIFLLISFWAGFSRMFLFCVFSWFVEKYKNVTSILNRFWSEFSRMLLFMFMGLIILRFKNVYSIHLIYI